MVGSFGAGVEVEAGVGAASATAGEGAGTTSRFSTTGSAYVELEIIQLPGHHKIGKVTWELQFTLKASIAGGCWMTSAMMKLFDSISILSIRSSQKNVDNYLVISTKGSVHPFLT